MAASGTHEMRPSGPRVATPLFSARGPIVRRVPRARGDSQLVASLRSAAATPPWTPHQLAEVVEQVAGVVGARPGLGMVLDRKRRLVAEGEAFDRVVVEVDMRELHRAVAGLRPQARRQRLARPVRRLEAEGLGGDGEAMGLRGGLDPARGAGRGPTVRGAGAAG